MPKKKQTRPTIPEEDKKRNLVSIMVNDLMRSYLNELTEGYQMSLSAVVGKVLWDVVPDMVIELREVQAEEEQSG